MTEDHEYDFYKKEKSRTLEIIACYVCGCFLAIALAVVIYHHFTFTPPPVSQKPKPITLEKIKLIHRPCDFELLDAIYYIEGAEKAHTPYGISSIKTKNMHEARKIALNTIRNQRKRHCKHKCKMTYLECLSRRYCPEKHEHWLNMVKSRLKRQKICTTP